MTADKPSSGAAPESSPGHGPASRALARAGVVVLLGYLLARALGYVRVLAYAAIFGAGPELDAFYVAFRLPDLVLGLVASGALAAAVAAPVSRAMAAGDREQTGRIASALLTWAAIALTVFGVLVFVTAPVLIPVLAPGFPAASTALAISLAQEMAVAPVLLGLGGMVAGVLQAERRFGPAMLGPIAYNVVSVLVALVLSGPLGAHALSVGVVIGSVTYLLVQLPALHAMRLRLRPTLNVAEPGLRRAVGLLAPRALGLSVDQLKLIVALAAASTLPGGSVTAFTIAYTIYQIPAGLLAVPLGTVVLPEMTTRHALGASASLSRLVTSALGLLVFIVLPLTALAVGLAAVIADLLFGHGNYSDTSVALTAGALTALFLGLPGSAVSAFCSRALYAAERSGLSIAVATLDLAIMILLVMPLTEAAGLTGIGLSFATGVTVAATVLVVALVRRVPGPAWTATLAAALRSAALAVGAGVLAAVAASALLGLDAPPHGPIADTVVVVAAGGASALLYLLVSWLLRAPEVGLSVRLLGRLRGRADDAGNDVGGSGDDGDDAGTRIAGDAAT